MSNASAAEPFLHLPPRPGRRARRGGGGKGRAEPGNLFFDWARSVDDQCEFWLTEGFVDDAAGEAHVQSEHFRTGTEVMSGAVATTPTIVSTTVEQDGWGEMGEVSPR